jgi:hypothetical protein
MLLLFWVFYNGGNARVGMVTFTWPKTEERESESEREKERVRGERRVSEESF